MARTRSSTGPKRSKTAEKALVPWSNLPEDLVLLIMMHLGLIDYIAFGCVCKNWRSIALFNRNKFTAIKEPMAVGIPPYAKRSCYLYDFFENRTFKTILPDYSGRSCVGLSHGYLIMFGRQTRDFWLMNLITRHELKFPVLPFSAKFKTTEVRPILVFSPKLSSFIFVILFKFSQEILYSLPGATALWRRLESDTDIVDLLAFNGKIYILHKNGVLGKIEFHPNPQLILIYIKNHPGLQFRSMQLVSSCGKLFVLNYNFPAFELDFDKMEWVALDPAHMTDYVPFTSKLKCGGLVNPNKWADPRKHSAMMAHFFGPEKNTSDKTECVGAYEVREGKGATSFLWFFPDDCYEVNRLDE